MSKVMMLKEAISLLKEVRFQQSNTGGCVIKSLDQVIQNLQAVNCKEFSEPEVATIILKEFDLLFRELPEIKRQLQHLARLKS